MALYFAYGSNLSEAQMRQRCPSSRALEPACLRHHRLAFSRFSRTRQCGVADIVPEKGHEVWGLLYELDESDLTARLDRYEGYPSHYDRVTRLIEIPGEGEREVWVYTVVEKEPFVPPSRAYLAILKDAAVRFDFPDGYRRLLDAVSVAG